MKKTKLDWNVYPAGADILLFDGAMHFVVVLRGNKWSAEVSVAHAAGGGALFICDGVSSREKAMLEAEAWIFKHAKELKATPRADAHTRVTKKKPVKKAASKKTGRCSYCGRSLRLQKFGTLPIHDAEMLASRRRFMKNPEQDDYYETIRCPGSQSTPLKGKWPGKVGVVC